MTTLKNKHLSFEDRCIIQEFLDYGYPFTRIGARIHKDRTTVAKEVLHHRFMKGSFQTQCELTDRPPYVCNGCDRKARCRKRQYRYEASIAHNEYTKVLSEARAVVRVSKERVAAVNEIISPLMVHNHHSVNHVYAEHPEALPFSKSTFYRYIDMGLLNIRNIDLQRKVRYKVKKEYDYTRAKVNVRIRNGRFYRDFQEYMDLHPDASVVEMDTVIGTGGGKGGKCFLTMLFRKSKLMLIFLLPYRRVRYVNEVFFKLKETLGDDGFSRLFEVVLTDNGTEFSDPETIEMSLEGPSRVLSHVFFCDPNCSWQKGAIEKNHQYIRYVLPKGTSFAGLTQEDCTLLANHINSVPRVSLNNHSPYEAAKLFIGEENMDRLNIECVPTDEINLSIRLLKR